LYPLQTGPINPSQVATVHGYTYSQQLSLCLLIK